VNAVDSGTRSARRVGPWLLWFAVLGGMLAWAFHLLFAWGVAELACMNGETEVIGLPLRGFVGLATGVPFVVALAATGIAWRVWRAPAHPDGDRSDHDASTPHSVRGGRPASDQGDKSVERARFLAQVGFVLDLLAVAATVFGAAALIVLEPCAR
jgi:hypothetical protein